MMTLDTNTPDRANATKKIINLALFVDLLVHHFEKRPHYIVLGLDFFPLSAQFGTVLLENGVGLLAHADGRPILAFHLSFIRFITDKYLRAPEVNGDDSRC